MSDVFRSKLRDLSSTLALQSVDEQWHVAAGLRGHADRSAIAVGSGGSAISAAFLAACRRDISTTSTLVATPMEFVLGTEDVSECQLWLFSGRGDNADVMASLEAAIQRNIRDVRLVTSNPEGRAAERARAIANCTVHLAPVADPKDGFLSTHSLIAAIAQLLAATGIAAGASLSAGSTEALVHAINTRLTDTRIAQLRSEFRLLRPESTLILLSDPALAPAAVALETSIWECALCACQRTDMRNFAHGRHVLLAQRPDLVQLVGLTSATSAAIWDELASSLPSNVATSRFDYETGSREDVTNAVVDALAMVEAIGNVLGVDPGKPGAGDFARNVYEGRSLERLATALHPAVRHKVRAIRQAGSGRLSLPEITKAHKTATDNLKRTNFDALILDYDGTIVATDDRYEPPRAEMAAQLSRLLAGGTVVGIATGRGGSVGEDLRRVLPTSLHERVVVGYYNGGFVRPLTVDIAKDRPPRAEAIAQMSEWLRQTGDLPASSRDSALQLSITTSDVADLQRLQRRIEAFPGFADGTVRIVRSKHSIDIGVGSNRKSNVRHAISSVLRKPDAVALCIGDSGHPGGNDFELLGEGHGISVDTVCPRSDGCWNLFGGHVAGPDAVVRILDAIELKTDGTFQLALARLVD